MMKRLSILFLVVGFVIFLGAAEAFGCQCAEKPTIAEEMEEWSQVVVTGRIESVQKIREEVREHDLGAYRSATLLVEKVYSGNIKAGDKLLLAQGGGADCAFEWNDESVGSKWLFYLGKPSTEHWANIVQDSGEISETEKVPMYRTSFCGRSTTLRWAAPDLAYLNNLAKRKGKTRISGTLSFGDRSVEGIAVLVKGKNGQFKSKYVKDGFFELYDIPPGEYIFEVLPPSGWRAVHDGRYSEVLELKGEGQKTKKNQELIRIVAGKHTEVDMRLAPDTMIKGRVLSPTNKPMANILVEAEPVNENENARGGRVETNAKGEFEFETIDPGNYILIANPAGKIDNQRPFGKLYYPGVAVKENAGLIAVQPGNYVVGLEIQVPQTTRLIEVTGRVLFADDKPEKNTLVSFEPSDDKSFDKISIKTDEDGRFSLMIPVGATGVVVASRYFSEYTHPNCAEIMAYLALKKSSDVKTTTLEINGAEPISGAILRFPFDFCEEK